MHTYTYRPTQDCPDGRLCTAECAGPCLRVQTNAPPDCRSFPDGWPEMVRQQHAPATIPIQYPRPEPVKVDLRGTDVQLKAPRIVALSGSTMLDGAVEWETVTLELEDGTHATFHAPNTYDGEL